MKFSYNWEVKVSQEKLVYWIWLGVMGGLGMWVAHGLWQMLMEALA